MTTDTSKPGIVKQGKVDIDPVLKSKLDAVNDKKFMIIKEINDFVTRNIVKTSETKKGDITIVKEKIDVKKIEEKYKESDPVSKINIAIALNCKLNPVGDDNCDVGHIYYQQKIAELSQTKDGAEAIAHLIQTVERAQEQSSCEGGGRGRTRRCKGRIGRTRRCGGRTRRYGGRRGRTRRGRKITGGFNWTSFLTVLFVVANTVQGAVNKQVHTEETIAKKAENFKLDVKLNTDEFVRNAVAAGNTAGTCFLRSFSSEHGSPAGPIKEYYEQHKDYNEKHEQDPTYSVYNHPGHALNLAAMYGEELYDTKFSTRDNTETGLYNLISEVITTTIEEADQLRKETNQPNAIISTTITDIGHAYNMYIFPDGASFTQDLNGLTAFQLSQRFPDANLERENNLMANYIPPKDFDNKNPKKVAAAQKQIDFLANTFGVLRVDAKTLTFRESPGIEYMKKRFKPHKDDTYKYMSTVGTTVGPSTPQKFLQYRPPNDYPKKYKQKVTFERTAPETHGNVNVLTEKIGVKEVNLEVVNGNIVNGKVAKDDFVKAQIQQQEQTYGVPNKYLVSYADKIFSHRIPFGDKYILLTKNDMVWNWLSLQYEPKPGAKGLIILQNEYDRVIAELKGKVVEQK